MDEKTKDAIRYRYLRAQFWDKADMFVITGGKNQVKLGTYCPSFYRLDELIDSAMQQEEQINGN